MLLLRGATKAFSLQYIFKMFQYMLLLRGATAMRSRVRASQRFQYMLLLRGATGDAVRNGLRKHGFNTCSSCEEQLAKKYNGRSKYVVSIHAPLARSNWSTTNNKRIPKMFQYMLLLRGATDNPAGQRTTLEFQYMLLLRGATANPAKELEWRRFQYMLLLRGATGVI